MQRKFDLLVFDWDGTLVDSTGHIVASIRSACADLGLPIPLPEQARHVIGLGLSDALAHVLPKLAQSRYSEVADRYRYHFLSGDQAVNAFSGVADGLKKLSELGYLLAVATGKSRRGLDRSLAAFGLESTFVATRCADEGFPKPHPDMLQHLMTRLEVPRARTLMIGDTTHDLQMALNAGVSALAVDYGAHPRQALLALSPLACAGSFEEVMQWLQENA